jgi:hypothetical protein
MSFSNNSNFNPILEISSHLFKGSALTKTPLTIPAALLGNEGYEVLTLLFECCFVSYYFLYLFCLSCSLRITHYICRHTWWNYFRCLLRSTQGTSHKRMVTKYARLYSHWQQKDINNNNNNNKDKKKYEYCSEYNDDQWIVVYVYTLCFISSCMMWYRYPVSPSSKSKSHPNHFQQQAHVDIFGQNVKKLVEKPFKCMVLSSFTINTCTNILASNIFIYSYLLHSYVIFCIFSTVVVM